MSVELPKLNYDFKALEPFMDAQTVEIHYTRHHQGYVDKTNAVLEKYPDLQDLDLEELMKKIPILEMEEADKTVLKNNGGGVLAHDLFWDIMGPEKEIDEKLALDLEENFGSVSKFKQIFSEAAKSHFASGWTWLVKGEKGKMQVYSTANHDSPLAKNHEPILVLDVWEHAYYLHYQNRRADYVDNWWNILKLI